jgi:hypothetical protein
LEAVIANQTADNGPILLLDMGLVIFLVRSGTGEGDLLELAILEEQVINKFAAIIGVNAEQSEGQGRRMRMV